jgi:hypothetical protein
VAQEVAELATDRAHLVLEIRKLFLDGLVMEITVALELLLLEAVVAEVPEVLAE